MVAPPLFEVVDAAILWQRIRLDVRANVASLDAVLHADAKRAGNLCGGEKLSGFGALAAEDFRNVARRQKHFVRHFWRESADRSAH